MLRKALDNRRNIVYSYSQKIKCKARHLALKRAVEKLTVERNSCCCVENTYVRNLYDYFSEEADGKIKEAIEKIDVNYIKEWEKFHRIHIGNKTVEQLSVCYLGGPEPENDFTELINLGILPHNIWAFESDNEIYDIALKQLCENGFPRPKLIATNIEKYFKDTPKRFDIFYYDACSTIVSKNALRVIGTMCKYHRLNSPGIIISNFSVPDLTHDRIKKNIQSVVDPYFFAKTDCEIVEERDLHSQIFMDFITEELLLKKYSDFTTNIILDTATNIIPLQRFMNSEYAKDMNIIDNRVREKHTFNGYNRICSNVHKFAYLKSLLEEEGSSKEYNNIITSMSGYEGYKLDIVSIYDMKAHMSSNTSDSNSNLKSTIGWFDREDSLFAFLDKPDSSLYIDLLINQLGYPLHFVTDKIERFSYRAKTNTMFMDIIPFDECRYIYDWLPATDQVLKSFSDESWQYVFRFAVDGLVKNRIKMNNDTFYKGSVIAKTVFGFHEKELVERVELYD